MKTPMKSVEHTLSFELPYPVSEIFPLFSPEGEKLWAPGWDYTNVMGTSDLSEDYVFMTQTHDHASTEAIWIVKKFDPKAYAVEFYKVQPGDKVGLIKVYCTKITEKRTRIEVTYKYIAISETGNIFVSGFDKNAYQAYIDEWQSLLTNYFNHRNST